MTPAAEEHDGAHGLAEELHRAAHALVQDDPFRALGLAEVAKALAGSCGETSIRTRAERTAAACRDRLLEQPGSPLPA